MATAIKSIKKKPPPEVNEGGFDDAALASIQGSTVEGGRMTVEEDAPDEPGIGHNSGDGAAITLAAREKLKQFVARIEREEETKKEIADGIRDIYAEAKSMGYDVKALRAAIRIRKQDRQEREEFEMILDTYLLALGEIAQEHYD